MIKPTAEYQTVWKFPLQPGVLRVPAKVVHVGIDPVGDQDGPTVWCQVTSDDEFADGDRLVCAYGTGHPIYHEHTDHLGSVVTRGGLVWHVYGTPPRIAPR